MASRAAPSSSSLQIVDGSSPCWAVPFVPGGSRTSVQRILRRPRAPLPDDRILPTAHAGLLAKRRNHIWMIDFTRLKGAVRPVFVGAVIDAFSRKVLAIGFIRGEPIPYETDEGVADFHALRATYATLLARADVSLVQAQRLMRHSTPALTANVYTRLRLDDGHAAVARIDLGATGRPARRRRRQRRQKPTRRCTPRPAPVDYRP